MPRAEVVYLRKPTRRDRGEYVALREKNKAFLARWMGTSPDGATTTFARTFDRILAANRGGRHAQRFVCRAEDDAIVGVVNLNEIARGAFHSAYLGYWIGRAFARRGYMTEALALALVVAFEELGLHRVEANIVPGNRPSIALVRRAGFRREGLSPRYLHIAGRWRDHERWALTVEEWRRVSGRGRPRSRAG